MRAGRGAGPPAARTGADHAAARARPGDRPAHPRRTPRRAAGGTAAARIPPARVPGPPCRPGGDAHDAAGTGLGPALRSADQRRRQPHQPPAGQARPRPWSPAHPYRARRRLPARRWRRARRWRLKRLPGRRAGGCCAPAVSG